MHFDVSEEFSTSILQAGTKKIDHIVDYEKAVVVELFFPSAAVRDSHGGCSRGMQLRRHPQVQFATIGLCGLNAFLLTRLTGGQEWCEVEITGGLSPCDLPLTCLIDLK